MPKPNPSDPASVIKQEAVKLWAERGYGSVTVSDICREANVSNGTFFYHYKSVSSLAFAVLSDRLPLQTFVNQLILHNGDTWSFVDLVFTHLDEAVVADEREFFRAVALEQSGSEYAWNDPTSLPHLIRYVLLRGQQRGEIRSDLPLDDMIVLAISSLIGSAVRWAHYEYKDDDGLQRAGKRMSILLDAFATPEALLERRARQGESPAE